MNNRSKFDQHNRSQPVDRGRRRVLLGATVAVGAGAFAGLRWMNPADAAGDAVPSGPPKDVSIVMFDNHGKRLGERTVPMVVKTAAQWKQQLSKISYRITRESGTEEPFSGRYVNKPDKPGIYRCICCNNALYSASTQFHSGTGWPSFWQPIAAENVQEHVDHSFIMTRTAISCTRCAAHLGHKFHDGPQPTGLRYCMDSVALHFIPTGTA